jgi:PAS domain S-box-containing protein
MSEDRMTELANIKRHCEDLEAQLLSDSNRESPEQALQAIVDAVPDIIYRIDAESRIVFISGAVRRYGLDPDALIGTSLFDLIHPDDRNQARHRVNDRRTGERSTRSLELRLIFTNDEGLPFELSESDDVSPKVSIDAQGVYSTDQPTSQDFLYTQGVARDVRGRQERSEALAAMHEDQARRLDEQAAQIRSAYHQLQLHVQQRERQEAESAAIQQVRDEIWRMLEPTHVNAVLRAIHKGLRDLGVDFFGISINDVDEVPGEVRYYTFADDDIEWSVCKDRVLNRAVIDFMAADVPTYRPDLYTIDSWGERPEVEATWGAPIRSIIDVPFESGTFAINSRSTNAFSEDDQRLLQKMAAVIREGFRRMNDLQIVQERSREAERLASERQAALEREVVLNRIRDRVLSMRSLSDAPQHRDITAALRELGVPVDGISLQFPASVAGRYETFYASGLSPANPESHSLDDHPWVRHAWETGKAVVVPAVELADTGFTDWQNWCILEVPLPTGGSLGINRRDGGTFDDDMVGTVEAFATVVAAGVQRLRDFGRLEQSEQRHRYFVEHLPLGVAHATVDGRVLYQNAAGWRMYGYPETEWATLTAKDLYVNLQDREQMLQALHEHGSAAFECAMWHKDGHQLWIRGISSLVANPTSGREEIHGYFEDVTERRQMEEQNTRLAEQLRQSQKMEAVGQLTAGIAHNFNNMLQGISGNLQLAILDAEGEMRTMLGDADRVTHRAAEMIRQLMVFARQGLRPVVGSVLLAPVIENTIEICRRSFDRKILIESELAEDIHVDGDPGLLQQVFLNVLINARDAVLDGGTDIPRITIAVSIKQVSSQDAARSIDSVEGPCVEIAVSDNGIGMDAETQRRIFDPFFTTKPVDRGTGLGLATVYGIITQYHGWIACESEPGSGSTFRMHLPLAHAEGAPEPEVAEPAPVNTSRRTLLVIDDEEIVREPTRRILQRSGYEVLVADSGPTGLAVVDQGGASVDLVLLDLSMPAMSGHDVLAELRRLHPTVKVLIMTGYATRDDEVDGAHGILQKPFAMADLLGKVDEILES